MNLPRCPFCYAPVQLHDDGTCPACRKDTRLATEENLRYTAIEVFAEESLPDCCVSCGADTDHLEHFVFHYDSHLGDRLDDQSYMAFLLLVVITAGIGFLFLPLYRRRVRKYRQFTYQLHLPFCDACLPHKRTYAPLNIEGNAFHLKVHQAFKTQLLLHRRGTIGHAANL